MFFFFFSSRRRHTRWPRDWSSDVCSSDLGIRIGGRLAHRARAVLPAADRAGYRDRRDPLPAREATLMRVWIDMTASAHVLVFRPLIKLMRERGDDVQIT